MARYARMRATAVVGGALLIGVACSKTTRIVAPTAPEPINSSPAGALHRMGWAWEHLNPHEYGTVLSADFEATSSLTDSVGNVYGGTSWTRDAALVCFESLVEGASGYGRVVSISMPINSSLNPQHDLRPGKTYPVHQQIDVSSISVTVRFLNGTIVSRSFGALVYVVRGDSAAIPPYLGLMADSTQWYIQRIDEETTGAPADTTHAPSPLCW